MFKKIASIAIAAMLIGSTAVIGASAAGADDPVAADDAVSVGADDGSSAVGADDGSETTGAASKVYFDFNTTPWNLANAKPTFYLYEYGSGEIITWGSKKGKMTDEGSGIFSYDLAAKGITLESGKQYGCIFTDDWNSQTCDLIIASDCIGDTAICGPNKIENTADSNKKSQEVHWKSGKYGIPKDITSIGNVVGEVHWAGATDYSLFLKFLTDQGARGLQNALKFNGKDMQTTIDDTAKALNLKKDDVKKAVAEAQKTDSSVKWDESKSSLESGSSGNAGTPSGGSDSNSGGGSSDSNSSSGGSSTSGGSSSGGSSSGGSSGGSSSGGSSSGSSSVTSGEDNTIYFVIGGVMLAAIGVLFLARKKREY